MKKRCMLWYLPLPESLEKPAAFNVTHYDEVVETNEVLNSTNQSKKKGLRHGK